MTTVCQSKRPYDTEWEALLNANRVEMEFGEEMTVYECLPHGHWHLTHKNPKLRRGVGNGYWKCPDCSAIISEEKKLKHKCEVQDGE